MSMQWSTVSSRRISRPCARKSTWTCTGCRLRGGSAETRVRGWLHAQGKDAGGGARRRSAPLTAVQLLWVNMIMDTLGALALATEPPNNEMMKRTPVRRGDSFITKVMWRNILGQALFQLLVLVTLMFAGKRLFHVKVQLLIKRSILSYSTLLSFAR